MRLVIGFLCLAILQAVIPVQAASVAEWPSSPLNTSLETPYGVLTVQASDYVYGATLLFDGKPTEPAIKGILNIPYAYVVGKRTMALVSQDRGQADCPVVYYWMTIGARGYQLTGPFGSCSAQIRVAARGALLQLETPDRLQSGRMDVWEFDGEKVHRQTLPERNERAR